MGRVKLIYFFGIDGSGKSTLSNYLCDELKDRGHDVSLTWWLEGEKSFIRRLIRSKGASSSVSSTLKPGKKSKSVATRLIQGTYYRVVLLDYFAFGIRKTRLPTMSGKNRVRLFDRYMYDVIYSLYKQFDIPVWRRDLLFRVSQILLPGPDLVFFIDVPPEVTYERKKDEIASVEEARETYAQYQELHGIISTLNPGKVCRIDNTRDIGTVKLDILNKTLALLGEDHEK